MPMAIVACKCPQCRDGEIFTKGAITFKDLGKVHEKCPNCDFRYEIEPGFFWAAMYISYGLNVAIMLTAWIAVMVLFDPKEIWQYLVPIIGSMLAFFPFTMRYSRVLLLYIFAGGKYKGYRQKLQMEE